MKAHAKNADDGTYSMDESSLYHTSSDTRILVNCLSRSQHQLVKLSNMLRPLLAMALLAVCALAAPANDLHPRQGGCKKVHFLFARGSTEGGTMGSTVGPAFSRALGSKFGANNVESKGVPYPADIAGAFSGGTNPSGSKGAIKMAEMAKSIIQKCPSAKIVLGGYSQGAEQVHGALSTKNLGADGAKIAAAVTYGDPLKNYQTSLGGWGKLPKEHAMVFCNSGDGVCGGAFSISAAHLSYTSNGDINKGVNFVAKVINDPSIPAPAADAPASGEAPSGGMPKTAGPKGAKGAKGGGSKGAGPKGAGPKGSGPPKSGESGEAESPASGAAAGAESSSEGTAVTEPER